MNKGDPRKLYGTRVSCSRALLVISMLCTYSMAIPALSLASTAKVPKPASEWKAGYDYAVLIPWEAPKDVPPGKIEVRELFLYTSSWSKEAQPYLQRWLDSKGSSLKYVREPAIAFPHAREQARMYYTLREMHQEHLHLAFFDFVREDDRFAVYHTIRRPAVDAIFDLNIEFAKRNGLNAEEFVHTYQSRLVDDRVISAEIDATGYALNGTSTFIVNGHYSTSLQRFLGADPARADSEPEAADYDRFFKLIDALVMLASKEPPPGPSAAPQPPK